MNPKPKPPLPGGEHVQVIDTGPQHVRPGVPTVNLVPVGDGGPGPVLPRTTRPKKRKPLLPGEREIARLPRWARVAFAARCARRVEPLAHASLNPANGKNARSRFERLSQVEHAAATASTPPDSYTRAGIAYVIGCASATKMADGAADAALLTLDPKGSGTDTLAARAASAAAEAILHVTSDPRDLLIIRSDFEWLRELAEENGWTDDTPVPPEVFGPLWPPRRVPHWAKEKNKSREESRG